MRGTNHVLHVLGGEANRCPHLPHYALFPLNDWGRLLRNDVIPFMTRQICVTRRIFETRRKRYHQLSSQKPEDRSSRPKPKFCSLCLADTQPSTSSRATPIGSTGRAPDKIQAEESVPSP